MPPQKKQKLKYSKLNMLVWNNDEFRLLLEVVKEFKSKKLYDERLNWESVKDNYIQFRNIPDEQNFSDEPSASFPRKSEEFTKDKSK